MGLTNNLGKLSNMITSTGSAVGIGTSSPNYKLQVSPSAVYGDAEDGNISINASPSGGTVTSPTTVGGIVFGDSNITNGYLGRLAVIQDNPSSTTASHMRFYTNGGGGNGAMTEKVRITSVGNVGIGTTSPLNKLDVRQASAIMGNYQTIQAFSTDSAAINLGGGISLGGYYTGTSSIAQFASIVGRKENSTSGNYDGYLAFGTNAQATGVVERMRINSSGNVLIGINSSAYKLDVTSADAYTTRFNSTAAQGGFTAWANSGTAYGYAGNAYHIVIGGSVGDMAMTSVGNLVFASGSGLNERMRINSAGNVGIGTSSPLQALGTTLTVAGTLLSNPSVSGGNYNENIRANRAGNGYSAIAIGSAYNTVSGTGTGQWTLVATPVALGYRFDFDYAGTTVSYINTSGTFVTLSDKNKKKDFEDSTIGLNAILGLKPTLYRMKDDEDNAEKQLGFIAQEVKEFIPQAYSETIDGFIGLQDRPIIAALVKAIQEQQKQIEELKSLINK